MNGEKGLRLKTIRLRGQLSQGLLLPLNMFPDVNFVDKDKDYSEDIGVIKWEQPIPACLGGDVEGMFPTSLMPKTDQERIQNLSKWFDKYKDIIFEETEKLDGSSCTIYWNEDKFGVCSRNLDLTESESNSFWKIAHKYSLK
jgi:RNA ligase (TIGR02306 family)